MATTLRMSGVALAAGALALLAATGCSGKIDPAKGEESIRKTLSDPSIGLTVQSVSCPADIPLQKGNVFTCKVTVANGDPVQVKITQKDDEGNVELDYKNSLFVPDIPNMKSALTNVEDITCPSAVALNDGKGSLVCNATGKDGSKAKMTFPIEGGKIKTDDVKVDLA